MNCTKCGKEIPDGESKLCEECQMKLLEEIKKEGETLENASSEVQEDIKEQTNKQETDKKEKSKKSKKKKEKSSEDKDENKFKVAGSDKKKNKINLIIAIVIVLILGVIIAVCMKFANNSNKVGNTIGNIRNYGYGTSDGKWIYYVSPNEDATKVGICKVKNKNPEEKQELLMNDMDILSLNVYKDYLYFIGVVLENYSETDDIDNKIYRMKTDGSDLEVINDNNFNNDCYEIYVLDNSIYYIGVDENIYKMNLDGTNAEMVSNNGTGYIGITDKYIIYNVENETKDNYITYIMNIDGTNPRPIVEGQRLYSVDILGDYVYYTNTDKHIYRTKIDSNEQELILETSAYNLNLKGDYLYFLNYANEEDYTVCLYRVKSDGSQEKEEEVKTLSVTTKYINVVGDWVMYMDYEEDSGFINLVNKNGNGEESKIYVYEYPDELETDVTTDNGTSENNAPVEDNNTTNVNSTEEQNTSVENVTPVDTTTVVNQTAPDTNTAVVNN